MTLLTYDILAETLFSGEIAGDPNDFAHQIDKLFETMGRVDPFDLLGLPDWLPRLTRLRGQQSLGFFRELVSNTIELRKTRMDRQEDVPSDFLTLLLRAEGPDGLSRSEIEDNIITFIGAGHETTARALGWTLYLLAKAPQERELIELEIDGFLQKADVICRRRNGWHRCLSHVRPSRRLCGYIRQRRRSIARRRPTIHTMT